MKDDLMAPAGPEPDPTDDPVDTGDEDQPWGEYQLEGEESVPEEAGYGYGV